MKFRNNKYTLTALSVTGGILSALAWTSWCPGMILLIAFVPYILIENHLYLNPQRYSINAYFTYILPGFVVFCIISLAWVRAANIPAAIAVIMEMSFLMSFILWMAHVVRVKAGNTAGISALISFWLAFEYLSGHSVYLSPWVNLGNGLSKDILFIQWYEITGVAGGTFWILISNLLLTLFLISLSDNKQKNRIYLFIWLSVVFVPSGISISRFYTIEQSDSNRLKWL
jgi:apolipoprotein N-acyltransferase